MYRNSTAAQFTAGTKIHLPVYILLHEWYNCTVFMTPKSGDTPVIPAARFICSAPHFKDMPAPENAEFCLLGRSNVGKSSFINHIFSDRNLARVSKTPGKTICANFFSVGSSMTWVDLPGYGYAKRAGAENRRITGLIRDYCANRTSLMGCIWLLDIRHPGMDADLRAGEWLSSLNRPIFTVLTKADKFGREQANAQARAFAAILGSGTPLVFSIHSPGSRERFWSAFARWANDLGMAGMHA
jgi:GTP-binding protein